MRAVCRTSSFGTEQRDIPVPVATPDHLVIKVAACGVNPGDKGWIAGLLPGAPESMYDVCGVSAAGTVVEIGERVPTEFIGRRVAVYRSLRASSDCVGTWCEFARMHHLTCVLLPEDTRDEDYCGSLVNSITPYVFLEQIVHAGHRAVVCTAGTSATGRAMLGVCLARNFPLISIVRTDFGRAVLKELGATHVLVAEESSFETALRELSEQLNATAVFDGVGGTLVGRVAGSLPRGSTIYSYGFLAAGEPLDFPTVLLLARDLTLTSFGIFQSPLVLNAHSLKQMLAGIQQIIGMPHFRTLVGRTFPLEQVQDALQFQPQRGAKVILVIRGHNTR